MRHISLRLGLATVMVALAVAPAQAALTDRQNQIESQKRALRTKIADADERAGIITAQIRQSDARRAALEGQIKDLTGQLATATARLVQAEADLGVARQDLIRLEGDLSITLVRLEALKERADERQRLVYQQGGTGSYISLLLGADNMRDFIGRLHYVRTVMSDDKSRIDGLRKLGNQLEASRTEVVTRKDEITKQKISIEAERSNIKKLQDQLKTSRAQVDAEIATRKQLLSKVQSEKASYLRQVAQLEAESRSISALLRSRQRGQIFKAGSGVRLAWPTTGRISSYYGWRTHPIFGDRRMHTGIDISAPSGQSVQSAEAGSIVYVGTKGGYGTVVIIDHGSALATLYAHLSATSVSSGQTVTRGQRVGSVGCSGYCTGPHLHFETRINGEPKDPMQFF